MRTRYIKPGFYENEELAALPDRTRLLYAGLWLMADRKGRLPDRPATIKGNLFPHDSKPVEGHLKALAAGGFITRYEAEGKKVIWITTFLAHQRPHFKEQASVLPAHPQEQEILAALHIPEEGLDTDPGSVLGTDRIPPGEGKGDRITVLPGNRGREPETVAPQNGGRPPSLATANDWDFTLSLYRRNIGEPDARARDQLKAFNDTLDPLWVRAAINQATGADDPGFGYVKRVLEDCQRTNQAPSSLAKSHR
jgi:hypothetical protein